MEIPSHKVQQICTMFGSGVGFGVNLLYNCYIH